MYAAGCRSRRRGPRPWSSPRGPSEAGDADSGVLQLVAAVDRGQDRGDALQRAGVGEGPDVDRAQAERDGEPADRVLGLAIVAAQKQIAVDGMADVGQF